ncbi:MAG: RDD family protein [Candidatus Eremiobacteraeota bacterium]|nr:RDD family protein [Candidatus Eremiobacteraeota bacterium]
MDRSVSIRTPESIRFSYDLAGLGSRFLAVVLDLLVQLALIAALFWGLELLARHSPRVPVGRNGHGVAASVAEATVIAIVFIIFFGYFIAFEALWRGQTPGKRALRIRVVRDGGYPVDLGSSLIRNLVRVGEAALGFYAISAVSALMSEENKRLGDYAAGTIVVRDERAIHAREVAEAYAHPSAGFSMLTDEERALIARFCARRETMAPNYRHQAAGQIANLLRPRLSRDLQVLDDDELLSRLNAS